MAFKLSSTPDIDTNDGTGSLSYSASSCRSDESSIAEESAYLSSFLEREQQLHLKEQNEALRRRSLRESPSPRRSGSISGSMDDDAACQKYCNVRGGENVSNKRYDNGASSHETRALHRPQSSRKTSIRSSPATVTPDESIRSGSKNSSLRPHHKRILSDPKNEMWYERLLCGMNSNC